MSEASVTLSVVTQLRIRDICLYVWTYIISILYFDPGIFCVSVVVDPVPNFTKQNPLVHQSLPVSSKEIEWFTTLISFAGAVKTLKNLPEFHSYSS